MQNKKLLDFNFLVERIKKYKNGNEYDTLNYCLDLMKEIIEREFTKKELIALMNKHLVGQFNLKDNDIMMLDEEGVLIKISLTDFYDIIEEQDTLLYFWDKYYYTKELRNPNPLYELVHEVGYHLDSIIEEARRG